MTHREASPDPRVFWEEGMLLRAQHFQLQDRHAEARLRLAAGALLPDAFGFSDLAFDPGRLAQGRIGLVRAAGLLRDGSPFALSAAAARAVEIEARREDEGRTLHLALPARPHGAAERRLIGPHGRWSRVPLRIEGDRDADDPVLEPVELDVLEPNFVLLRGHELSGAWDALPIARIAAVSGGGGVTLDPDFCPPLLRAGLCEGLRRRLGDILLLVATRADDYAARAREEGTGRGDLDPRHRALLAIVNRAHQTFHHLGREELSQCPPAELHRALAELAGELVGWVDAASPRLDPLPAYVQADPGPGLIAAFAQAERLLRLMAARDAVRIPLARRGDYMFGKVEDGALLARARFVLIVEAPRHSRRDLDAFPRRLKIGAGSGIERLVRNAEAGLPAAPLDRPPRELPQRERAGYLELDRAHPYWADLAQVAVIALHVTDPPEGLSLQLWAIPPEAR